MNNQKLDFIFNSVVFFFTIYLKTNLTNEQTLADKVRTEQKTLSDLKLDDAKRSNISAVVVFNKAIQTRVQ